MTQHRTSETDERDEKRLKRLEENLKSEPF